MFVIKKSNGHYVSNPNTNGTGCSYSRTLKLAKVFDTLEDAIADKCGNERIETVSEQLAIR